MTDDDTSRMTLRKEEVPMVAVGRTSLSDQTATLKVGDPAPDFTLPGHRNKEKFTLSEARGKKNTVLVFYPLDWTPV
jgi:peroxiredoxin